MQLCTLHDRLPTGLMSRLRPLWCSLYPGRAIHLSAYALPLVETRFAYTERWVVYDR